MVTVDDVPNLRVVDLKAELKARDLPIAGLKAALTDRLIEALQVRDLPVGSAHMLQCACARGTALI